MKAIKSVVCTVLSGVIGLWIGSYMGAAGAGAIVCAMACMGGFIVSSLEKMG